MGNKATLWKLEQDKQELVASRDKRMEGALLRSRARWTAEGEQITKYFCGLKKQMTRVTLNNGEEIYESKDIIKEVKMHPYTHPHQHHPYTRHNVIDKRAFDFEKIHTTS